MTLKILLGLIFWAFLAFTSCKDQSKNLEAENNAPPKENETILKDENQGTDAFVENIRNYIRTEFLTAADLRAISQDQRKFQLETIDLNNDGIKETFVFMNTSYFCGTGGCTILLLSDQAELITKFTVTRPPVFVEEATVNGWRILLTLSEEKWRKLIYQDGTYPSNPSMVVPTTDTPSKSAQLLFGEDDLSKTYSF